MTTDNDPPPTDAPPAEPVEWTKDQLYTIERIVSAEYVNDSWRVRVKWEGYDQPTPEPLQNILRDTNHPDILAEIKQCQRDFRLAHPEIAERERSQNEQREALKAHDARYVRDFLNTLRKDVATKSAALAARDQELLTRQHDDAPAVDLQPQQPASTRVLRSHKTRPLRHVFMIDATSTDDNNNQLFVSAMHDITKKLNGRAAISINVVDDFAIAQQPVAQLLLSGTTPFSRPARPFGFR